MSGDPHLRPGIDCMVGGAVFLGFSAAALIGNWAPGPALLLFAFGFGVIAAGLFLRGWSRLSRAKAARPDLSWWQFLHVHFIALAVVLVWLPIFAAMSPEQRNNL